MQGHDWRNDERRKDGRGWTWWKEIAGTMVGVLTVIAIPAGVIWNWARNIEDRVNTQIITTAIQAGQISNLRDQRGELVDQLKTLNVKIDTLLREGLPVRR